MTRFDESSIRYFKYQWALVASSPRNIKVLGSFPSLCSHIPTFLALTLKKKKKKGYYRNIQYSAISDPIPPSFLSGLCMISLCLPGLSPGALSTLNCPSACVCCSSLYVNSGKWQPIRGAPCPHPMLAGMGSRPTTMHGWAVRPTDGLFCQGTITASWVQH